MKGQNVIKAVLYLHFLGKKTNPKHKPRNYCNHIPHLSPSNNQNTLPSNIKKKIESMLRPVFAESLQEYWTD